MIEATRQALRGRPGSSFNHARVRAVAEVVVASKEAVNCSPGKAIELQSGASGRVESLYSKMAGLGD